MAAESCFRIRAGREAASSSSRSRAAARQPRAPARPGKRASPGVGHSPRCHNGGSFSPCPGDAGSKSRPFGTRTAMTAAVFFLLSGSQKLSLGGERGSVPSTQGNPLSFRWDRLLLILNLLLQIKLISSCPFYKTQQTPDYCPFYNLCYYTFPCFLCSLNLTPAFPNRSPFLCPLLFLSPTLDSVHSVFNSLARS